MGTLGTIFTMVVIIAAAYVVHQSELISHDCRKIGRVIRAYRNGRGSWSDQEVD